MVQEGTYFAGWLHVVKFRHDIDTIIRYLGNPESRSISGQGEMCVTLSEHFAHVFGRGGTLDTIKPFRTPCLTALVFRRRLLSVAKGQSRSGFDRGAGRLL